MKTFSAKPHEVKRDWYVVDATRQGAGPACEPDRAAPARQAQAEFTPHVDTGDYIVVINAEKFRVTGSKAEDKIYYRHSGYPGGISKTNFAKMQAALPRPRAGEGGEGHAAQGPARLRDAEEAQVLRGRRAPAHGAATQDPGDLRTVT